jgi:ketosteroid isomerase-like protein
LSSCRSFRSACFVALLVAAGAAQALDVAIEPAQWQADETQIRRSLEASTSAFNRGDLPGHLAIYDNDVNFMSKNGPRPSIAPIEKDFGETYFRDGKPIQQLRFEQLAVRPITADVALATARFVLSGGEKPDQTGWFTLV